MLFQGLSKLKRTSIMTSIVLMAVGIVVLICPEAYISSLIGLLGVLIVVASIIMILEFLSSKKALIDLIMLTIALVLLILGSIVLIFRVDMIYVIAWMFGIGLIVAGASDIIHAFMYARRSGRKAWWVLVILSGLTITFGVIIICNPWWNTPGSLMKVIGLMVVFSAIVSALRLIWIWPIRTAKEV